MMVHRKGDMVTDITNILDPLDPELPHIQARLRSETALRDGHLTKPEAAAIILLSFQRLYKSHCTFAPVSTRPRPALPVPTPTVPLSFCNMC
jgi:hypothetical protein